MENKTITVSGKTYPIKFGYGATRWLGDVWALPGVLDVYQKALGVLGIGKDAAKEVDVDKISSDKEAEKLGAQIAESILQFENLEMIADIIQAGIYCGGGSKEVKRNDLLTELMNDILLTTQLYTAFIMTMPRPKENNTPEPVKKTGKR